MVASPYWFSGWSSSELSAPAWSECASPAAEAVRPPRCAIRIRRLAVLASCPGRVIHQPPDEDGGKAQEDPERRLSARVPRPVTGSGQTGGMSMGTPSPGRAAAAASPIGLEFPQSLAVYDDYAAAQKA